MSQIVPEEKTEASLFLDLSNIFCTAIELRVRVDFKKLVSNLSEHFALKGLFAFINSRVNNGLIEALYNIGFTVYPIPYNCDALMGFKIGELTKTQNTRAVIIGTHDGDFRGICDELEQKGIQVYFLGFKNRFSTFLQPKPCLVIECLGGNTD